MLLTEYNFLNMLYKDKNKRKTRVRVYGGGISFNLSVQFLRQDYALDIQS